MKTTWNFRKLAAYSFGLVALVATIELVSLFGLGLVFGVRPSEIYTHVPRMQMEVGFQIAALALAMGLSAIFASAINLAGTRTVLVGLACLSMPIWMIACSIPMLFSMVFWILALLPSVLSLGLNLE